MSEGFNPYKEWLQVAESGGRPNHYQLLGLPTFAHDPEQINRAAQEKIRLVRTYQMGPQRGEALRLIGELSDAFACLKDPDSKRTYDQRLRQAATAVVESPETLSDAPPVPVIAVAVEPNPAVFVERYEAEPVPVAQPAAVPLQSASPVEDEYSEHAPQADADEVAEAAEEDAGSPSLVWVVGGIAAVIAAGVLLVAFMLSGGSQVATLDPTSLPAKRVAGGSSGRVSQVSPENWLSQPGQEILNYEHTGLVAAVAFSPDGKRIASGSSDDGVIKVWDAQTGQVAITLRHQGVITLAFTADGKQILSGSSVPAVTAKVWNAQTGQEIHTHTGDWNWSNDCVAFSSDGEQVVSGNNDKIVRLWDRGIYQEPFKGHSDRVISVAISPDGKWIVSGRGGTGKDTIKVWNAQTGQETLNFKGHDSSVFSLAFSPDGKWIASGDETIKVWDAQTGQEALTLKGHSRPVKGLAFSPDGSRLASGSWDQTIKVWDTHTGENVYDLNGHKNLVISVAFSADGKRLASVSYDGTVKVWDVRNVHATIPSPVMTSPTVPPPGEFTGTQAGQVREDNGLKMKLCWCPPGEFTMGSPKSETGRGSDEDQVQVTLSKGFWLGKHEVTQSEWQSVMGTSLEQQRVKASYSRNIGVGATHPMYYVSHAEATEFCVKLTVQERQASRLPAGWEYRLPTEAQWEYACRAGKRRTYSFGDTSTTLGEYAWFTDNSNGETHPVGEKKANDFGLCDMHGNVWEWCWDGYLSKLPGGTDPDVSQQGSLRVLRGGGWDNSAGSARSAIRYWFGPSNRGHHLGFRLALSPSAAIPALAPPVPPPGDFRGTRAGQVREDNGLKMKLCWCPPGAFTMGSPKSEPVRGSDEDQVQVTLSKGFWLGKHEVTQSQWQTVMGTSLEQQRVKANESKTNGEGATHPMYYVTHDEATEFCVKLTADERQAGRLPAGWEYRLPTEAQWEYACRARKPGTYSFGDTSTALGEYAWYHGNSNRESHPVGEKKANDFGLCDMYGNVWEWCRDLHKAKLPGGSDPEASQQGSPRVIRGGGWNFLAGDARSANRDWEVPSNRSYRLGFRLALSPTGQ